MSRPATRSAAGRLLAAAAVAFFLVATTTFVVPSSSSSSSSHDSAKYVQLRGGQQWEQEDALMRSATAGAPRAAALAAIVGLMAGTAPVVPPAYAQEAAAPPADAAPAPVVISPEERIRKELEADLAKRAGAPSKEERLKRALAQVQQEKVGDEFFADPGKAQGGGIAADGVSLKSSKRKPVKAEKAGAASEEAPKKKKIISPADDLDEDELPWARANPPLFWTVFLAPSFIYLAFYVLGSLNII